MRSKTRLTCAHVPPRRERDVEARPGLRDLRGGFDPGEPAADDEHALRAREPLREAAVERHRSGTRREARAEREDEMIPREHASIVELDGLPFDPRRAANRERDGRTREEPRHRPHRRLAPHRRLVQTNALHETIARIHERDLGPSPRETKRTDDPGVTAAQYDDLHAVETTQTRET
jgi:hypothetical protein